MKKVLIILFEMIPYSLSWGSCQRMYYIASDLGKMNYDVTVMSCMINKQENYYGKDICFNQVLLDCNANTYSKLFKNVQSMPKNDSKEKGLITKRIKNHISRFLFNEPIAGRVSIAINEWINYNKTTICNYIIENHINSVIISCPPFAMFNLVSIIKTKCLNVKIIIDYRDPWNLWKKGSFLTIHRENRILRDADFITVTNSNMKKALSEKFRIVNNKVYVVENGYREEDWNNIEVLENDKKIFVYSYIGSIDLCDNDRNSFRGVREILSAFSRICDLYDDVVLRFVGVDKTDNDYLNSLLGRNVNRLEVIRQVSQKIALQYEMDSDVLLLIHNSTDASSHYIISGKFYDYVRAKKPILSVHCVEGLHKELIDYYGIGISVYNNADEIFSAMNKLHFEWVNGELQKRYSCKKDIKAMSRECQNKIMDKVLSQEIIK